MITGPADEPFPAFRKVTMMNGEKAGVLRRILGALGGFLKRGLLGKSAHGYAKQFADTGTPQGRTSLSPSGKPGAPGWTGAVHLRGAGTVAVPAAATLSGTARRPADLEFEPVHGWTGRQRDDYLGRNPAYRARYEAALRQF